MRRDPLSMDVLINGPVAYCMFGRIEYRRNNGTLLSSTWRTISACVTRFEASSVGERAGSQRR